MTIFSPPENATFMRIYSSLVIERIWTLNFTVWDNKIFWKIKKILVTLETIKLVSKFYATAWAFLNEWSKLVLGKATFFRWTIVWLIFALFESSHKISFSFRKCGKSKRDLNTETVEKMDAENSLFLVCKICNFDYIISKIIIEIFIAEISPARSRLTPNLSEEIRYFIGFSDIWVGTWGF